MILGIQTVTPHEVEAARQVWKRKDICYGPASHLTLRAWHRYLDLKVLHLRQMAERMERTPSKLPIIIREAELAGRLAR